MGTYINEKNEFDFGFNIYLYLYRKNNSAIIATGTSEISKQITA
jgi:hypothetical protein